MPQLAKRSQEGPFDFRSPVQNGRPEVPFHFEYGQPEPDEHTAEQRERLLHASVSAMRVHDMSSLRGK